MINPDRTFADIIEGLRDLPPSPVKVEGVISLTRRNVARDLHKLADHIERGGPPPNLEDERP